MGEYLTIIWDAETPSASTVPWDNTMLIVHGSEASLTETEIIACTTDDWTTQLTSAGFTATDQGYKSVANYFAASPTPGGTLYVLALVSGSIDILQNLQLTKITNSIFETPTKPPLGFYGVQQVRYYPDSSLTGYFENKADGSVGIGFTLETDNSDNWTGRLTFADGLSGNVIDEPPRVGSKITASYRIGKATSDVSENITKYNINMMAASYANTRAKTNFTANDCYYGSQADDLSRFTNAIAGKNCLFFWNFPGNASYATSGIGFSNNWESLRNFVGAREDVSLIKIKPSSSNHDMAAGLLGMTAGTHPHKTMSFAQPHMGIQEEESLIARTYWTEGQIISPMERRELQGNPYLLSHGFTLGAGYSSRISYVRCKYIISANLVNGLWALLASRTVKMSYAGMQLVRNKIAGIFKTLQDQGIHDGLAYINIPVEDDLKVNNAAGQAARLAFEIPSITIGFYWFSSLERIVITGIRNEA